MATRLDGAADSSNTMRFGGGASPEADGSYEVSSLFPGG